STAIKRTLSFFFAGSSARASVAEKTARPAREPTIRRQRKARRASMFFSLDLDNGSFVPLVLIHPWGCGGNSTRGDRVALGSLYSTGGDSFAGSVLTPPSAGWRARSGRSTNRASKAVIQSNATAKVKIGCQLPVSSNR